MIKKHLKNSERGQAIILIAFAIVGLVAIVGLMTDGGMLLVEYARLKRGIDAAAIAAALQFRKNYDVNDLSLASEEFLKLNQSDVYDVAIDTCDSLPEEERDTDVLCAEPRRKLVRVTASRNITFGFLRVIGINDTIITATSVGEAASIDLLLVIDTSASMAYETATDGSGNPINPNSSDPGDDPALCNTNENCEPLESVKGVALNFINNMMFFPYDPVAIVTMTSQNAGGFRNPMVVLPLSDDLTEVQTAIQNIKVFQPQDCNTAYGPCLRRCTAADIADPAMTTCYGGTVGNYVRQECPVAYVHGPASCNSSNVGGSLLIAGSEFARPDRMKQDSFWVVIALVGGPANATDSMGAMTDSNGDNYPDDPLAFGFCPTQYCRDASAESRHFMNANGTFPDEYDAEDFARDQADFLANPVTGSGVTVFTIGLGYQIQNANAATGDPLAGEKLLQYIAQEAGDTHDPNTGAITVTANHGSYYYTPDSNGLAAIFSAIADNILTRISQ